MSNKQVVHFTRPWCRNLVSFAIFLKTANVWDPENLRQGCGKGVQAQLTKISLQRFLVLSLFYLQRGSNCLIQRKLKTIPGKGVQFFQGLGVGVLLLIPMEAYTTCDFTGGMGVRILSLTPWIRPWETYVHS